MPLYKYKAIDAAGKFISGSLDAGNVNDLELRLLRNDKGLVPEKIYKAKGCTSCDNTGYKGRMALLEILKMNSDLDDLLAHGATTKEIKEAAYTQGYFTLADDGVRHIIEGVTSIKEVTRVADLTERMD